MEGQGILHQVQIANETRREGGGGTVWTMQTIHAEKKGEGRIIIRWSASSHLSVSSGPRVSSGPSVVCLDVELTCGLEVQKPRIENVNPEVFFRLRPQVRKEASRFPGVGCPAAPCLEGPGWARWYRWKKQVGRPRLCASVAGAFRFLGDGFHLRPSHSHVDNILQDLKVQANPWSLPGTRGFKRSQPKVASSNGPQRQWSTAWVSVLSPLKSDRNLFSSQG